jgi:hypothetical protein
MTALLSATNMKLVEEETENFIGLLFSVYQSNCLGSISTILLLTTNESMAVYYDLLFLKTAGVG